MINFTLEQNRSGIHINACEADGIRVNGKTLAHSLALTPDTLSHWPPRNIDQLDRAALEALLLPQADVIIIGTGRQHHQPPMTLLAPLFDLGVGVEVMTSAAACRTFNIIAAEGRHPVAGIIFETG